MRNVYSNGSKLFKSFNVNMHIKQVDEVLLSINLSCFKIALLTHYNFIILIDGADTGTSVPSKL